MCVQFVDALIQYIFTGSEDAKGARMLLQWYSLVFGMYCSARR